MSLDPSRIKPLRQKTSVFLDPTIHQPFLQKCREMGVTSCSVIEAFEYGFTTGMAKAGPLSPLPVVNVNMNITQPRVKRRRLAHEPLEANPVHELGDLDRCAFCNLKPMYQAFLSTRYPDRVQAYLCPMHYHRLNNIDVLVAYHKL